MIVDCHTRIWNTAIPLAGPLTPERPLLADESHHLAAASPVDRSIVLAFKSSYLQAEIPNQLVADYVRRNPQKIIGFAGIDPTDHDWLTDLRVAQDELHLKGVIISPALQNFHPADTRAMPLYEQCARRRLPVVFELNNRNPSARMEFAQPMLLDQIALEFPNLRFVVARMGHPWVAQTVVLLGKHAHAYADIAGLLPHPWLSYSALLAAHEYGVMGKLLFGSDFPFRSPAACIEALYSVNQFSHSGTLPAIPREQLRGIVERDALQLLGIGGAAAPSPAATRTIFTEDD